MGHSKSAKTASHDRILEVAARRFRERGFDGVSIADVMAEAGLTHGGFYKHFPTRDALLAASLDAAFADTRALVTQTTSGEASDLDAFLKRYLAASHVSDAGGGCPVAALSADVGRTPATQAAFEAAFDRYVDWLARRVGGPESQRRNRAAAIAAAIAGGLSVARALGDSALASEVLKGVRGLILSAEAAGGDR